MLKKRWRAAVLGEMLLLTLWALGRRNELANTI